MRELSDAEILERFGPLFEEADSAFRSDPSYVVEIAEAAAKIRQRRAARPPKPKRATKPKRKPLTLEARIVQRRGEGATLARIASEVNCPVSRVKRVCAEAGVTTRRANQALTPEEREIRDSQIRERRHSGANIAEIAREFGLSRPGVRLVLRQVDTPP